MNALLAVYLEGRVELQAACARRLAAEQLPAKALSAVFWGDFYADDGHLPVDLNGAELPRGGFTAPDFAAAVSPEIGTAGEWRRLCVTTTWHLDLAGFSGPEEWFSSLSAKNRKKLRWLRNALPKLETRIVPLATDADFGLFEQLYCAQFPKHALHSPEMCALREIYRELAARGKAVARLLLPRLRAATMRLQAALTRSL